MIYILDTNTVSDYLKRHRQVTVSVEEKLVNGDRLLIPPPVHYELIRGMIRHNATMQLRRLNDEILPYFEWMPISDADWQQAAQLWADVVRQGKQLSDVDLLLAAGSAGAAARRGARHQ